MHHLPERAPGIKILTEDAFEALLRLHPGLLKYSPGLGGCITCEGRGSFRWWDLSRSEIVEYECPCEDQWDSYVYLLFRGVPKNYQKLHWHDGSGIPAEATEAAIKFLANAKTMVSHGRSMMLMGPKGRGKTMLGQLMVKHLLGHGYFTVGRDGFGQLQGFECYATSFREAVDLFGDRWKSEDEKQLYRRNIQRAEVLLIDDAEQSRTAKSHSLATDMLIETMRSRVQAGATTIITTNYDVPQFQEVYGPQLYGLLQEACGPSGIVDFSEGERDWHMLTGQHRTDEALEGIMRPIEVVCPYLEEM